MAAPVEILLFGSLSFVNMQGFPANAWFPTSLSNGACCSRLPSYATRNCRMLLKISILVPHPRRCSNSAAIPSNTSGTLRSSKASWTGCPTSPEKLPPLLPRQTRLDITSIVRQNFCGIDPESGTGSGLFVACSLVSTLTHLWQWEARRPNSRSRCP